MLIKNDLFDYKNRYIYQDTELFKFSLDSILLAEFVDKKFKNKKIIDLCTGNMSIPLILSTYTSEKIVGFEIQKQVYNLGIDSIKLNKLEDQLQIINDDIKNINKYYKNDYFDIMICNPPFFKTAENSHINIKEELSIARHEIKITIEDIFNIAKTHLNNKGCLYIVHRVERLDEIVYLGYKYQINVKKIQFISTKEGEKPYILLIKAVKGSKPGVKVNSTICIENVKTYQNIFKEEE